MEKCRYKVGILNLRDCGADAPGLCGSCSRPVCMRHGKGVAGREGIFCPECRLDLEKGGKQGQPVDGDENLAMQRRSMYHSSGYSRPFFFGAPGVYGSDDYRAFESSAAPAGGADEGGLDEEDPGRKKKIKGTDFQDS